MFMFFLNKISLKIHKLHLFCCLNILGNQINEFFTELNPHATELIVLTPVPANKIELFRT